MQGGLHAANTIKRRLKGADSVPFKYRDLGSAAAIGRFKAIVSVRGLRLSGFPGWVVWLFVHLAFLNGFGHRFAALWRWGRAMVGRARPERVFSVGHTGGDLSLPDEVKARSCPSRSRSWRTSRAGLDLVQRTEATGRDAGPRAPGRDTGPVLTARPRQSRPRGDGQLHSPDDPRSIPRHRPGRRRHRQRARHRRRHRGGAGRGRGRRRAGRPHRGPAARGGQAGRGGRPPGRRGPGRSDRLRPHGLAGRDGVHRVRPARHHRQQHGRHHAAAAARHVAPLPGGGLPLQRLGRPRADPGRRAPHARRRPPRRGHRQHLLGHGARGRAAATWATARSRARSSSTPAWPRATWRRASGSTPSASGSTATSALDIVMSSDELRTAMEDATPLQAARPCRRHRRRPSCTWSPPPAPTSPARSSRSTAACSRPTSSSPSPTSKEPRAMPYRVVQWSTGNVGRHALAGIDAHPELELVGSSSPTRTRWGATPASWPAWAAPSAWRRRATSTRCSALQARLHRAHRHGRRPHLRGSGRPGALPGRRHQRGLLEPGHAAVPGAGRPAGRARHRGRGEGGRSPSSSTASTRASPTTRCRSSSRASASASKRSAAPRSSTTTPTTSPWCSSTSWASAATWTTCPCSSRPGVLTMAWGSVVRQIAAGLGVTLTDVTEWYEREAAPEDFEVDAGTIKAGHGGRAALRGARHGGRPGRRRARARDAGCATTSARRGPSRPGRAATGSRSPASPTTPSTSS